MKRFPETKGRTLEEIGALFGDEHIASRWYDATKEEKERVAHEAVTKVPDSGDEVEIVSPKSEAKQMEKV